MLNRRRFLGTLSAGLLAAPLAAEAQQAGKVYRIGVLSPEAHPPGLFEAFSKRLRELGYRELGYMEGKNFTLESRHAGGRHERLAVLAEELVRLRVDVIVAVNTPAAQAAKNATVAIPIVITRVSDRTQWPHRLWAEHSRHVPSYRGLRRQGPYCKGAKPADLPSSSQVSMSLVINLKTAKALGLTIPPSLRQRADQVIE